MHPLLAETTLEVLEKILDKHGVPIVLLAVIGLALWRILVWAKGWLEPIARGHVELIEELKKHAPQQTEKLEEVKQEMHKQSDSLESIDTTTKKTAEATTAISNITMQNQQTTHQVLDKLGDAVNKVGEAVKELSDQMPPKE